MDIATIVGLLIAFGCLSAGIGIEGGHAKSFVSLSSFLIVVGGSVGAMVIGFPLEDVKRLPEFIIQVIKPPRLPFDQTMKRLVEISNQVRRGGVLSLESSIAGEKDKLIQVGLQLLVDGADSEVMEQVMLTRIEHMSARNKRGKEMFESLGGFSPTLGIVGTVTGLIHVLGNLSEPGKLGEGIAQAFVATLYGIGFANLIYLPCSTKLKNRDHELGEYQQMILSGLLALQAGDNPLVVEQKLEAFIPHGKKSSHAAPKIAA